MADVVRDILKKFPGITSFEVAGPSWAPHQRNDCGARRQAGGGQYLGEDLDLLDGQGAGGGGCA